MNTPHRREMLVAASLACVAQVAWTASLDQCIKDCPSSQAPYCLALPDSLRLSAPVSKLSNALNTKNKLTAAELMALFTVKADPCRRSSTDVTGGRFTNRGDACAVRVSAKLLTDEIGVNLLFPTDLSGTVSKVGDSTRIEFADAFTAPVLHIADDKLDPSFGGLVRGLDLSAQRAIIATSRGCIRYEF